MIFAMDLRQHRQDKLHEKEEVGGAKPRYTSIAHLCGETFRHSVEVLLSQLLLIVEACITLLLLLDVVQVFLLEPCSRHLLRYVLKKTEWRRQVL